MADRFDLPRVPTHTPPSKWNHDTAKWGLIGGIVGQMVAWGVAGLSVFAPGAAAVGGTAAVSAGILAWAAPFVTPLLVLGAGYMAAQYGAKIGMAEQARELAEGHTVQEPNYINKGTVTGLSIGTALGMALINPPLALGLGLLAAAGGSVLQKNKDEKDFNLAIAQHNYETRGQGPAVPMLVPGKGVAMVQYKDSVTRDEAQALEARQDAGRNDHSHSQNVMASDAIPLEQTR